MTAHAKTIDKARALASIITGEKPADVAARHGVDPRTLRGWQEELDGDEALRTAVTAALRAALEGWRPAVRELIVDLVQHVRTRLDQLEPGEAIGAIRALAGVVGEADALARRAGLDGPPTGARKEDLQ